MHYNANDQRETAVPTYWKTDIYEISTVTYALTKVATIDMPLYTMSADNGYIYGITPDKLMKKTQLVRIDQSTIDPASRTCTVETVSPSTARASASATTPSRWSLTRPPIASGGSPRPATVGRASSRSIPPRVSN